MHKKDTLNIKLIKKKKQLFCCFIVEIRCRQVVYFLLRTILAVQMGAMMAGQISALSPDYVKAKIAAGRMFKLFSRTPVIQSDSEEGLQPVSVTAFYIFV